jgi:hypothetical protein
MLLARDANGANPISGHIGLFQQAADDGGTGFNPPIGLLLPPPAYIFDKLMVSIGFGQNPAFFPAENNAFCALGAAVNADEQLVFRHGEISLLIRGEKFVYQLA